MKKVEDDVSRRFNLKRVLPFILIIAFVIVLGFISFSKQKDPSLGPIPFSMISAGGYVSSGTSVQSTTGSLSCDGYINHALLATITSFVGPGGNNIPINPRNCASLATSVADACVIQFSNLLPNIGPCPPPNPPLIGVCTESSGQDCVAGCDATGTIISLRAYTEKDCSLPAQKLG